ncbi:hypothetical protein H6G97_41800 [Nostoc flagelliforme FACHB-838]|uniref:PEP-CTERM sorting domain-containing protein n=1 Tax=Nostoc flagelliforme FACHB-838 TaxID=2692904 RepID=A0ABR8E4P9_9NOSO|nr:hypothetical protein [Nostoc flagelliforme]MBD2535573.1 hypothetical protein [Nostoc flagelliforme FACHB-838]MBX9252501.1 hypothetical protein [Desmonostoc muscorum CCALA 125]
MKLKQLAAIAGATLVTFTTFSSKGLAATIINPQLDSYIPKPSDIVVGTCSQVGVCFPGQEIPSSTSVFPFVSRNDSNFDVTSIFLTIDPSEDAVWGNGVSNIYNNIQISPDAKKITFNQGVIPVGEYLFADALTTPAGTAVKFSIAIDGTSIPEPDSVLGTLVFGSIGASSYFRRYLKRKAQQSGI